jgi:hypothetical protein
MKKLLHILLLVCLLVALVACDDAPDETENRISKTTYPTYYDAAHDNMEVHYSTTLKAGTYTIVFSIDEYTKPGIKEAVVRLQPLDEI